MTVQSAIPRRDRIAVVFALGLSVVQAVLLLGPLAGAPGDFLVGSHIHPDNLANHWLLHWGADAVLTGGELAHTTAYYWPVGDAPLLSGDGTQAVLYTPLHALLPWPVGVTVLTGLVLALNGLCGWFAAREVSGAPYAALLAVVVCGWSPYALMELSAGRFAQVAVWPLLLFFGLWWRYLDAPSPRRAVAAAAALFVTTASYWYYGWFGVLAGALAWTSLRRQHPAEVQWTHWRWHALFSAVFLVLLAPLAVVFALHWAAVPGSAETLAFPPESASHDRLPFLPVLLPGDPGTTAALQAAVVWALAGVGAVLQRRQRRVQAAILVGMAFFMLGWGPAFSGAPYTVLYGLAAPLRRFWWPVRHVAVMQGMLAILASVGVASLARRWTAPRWAWGTGASALVAGSLWVQGAPRAVERTPLTFPTEGYARLAALDAGAVVVFPLAPEATGTNDAMLHQLAHGHPMVMGHSPWVERARPPAWDAWLAEQPFLAALADMERSGSAGAVLSVDAADIASLREQGVRWFVLDRTLVPLALKGMVRSHDLLLDAVFGRPVVRTSDVQVWDIENFVGTVEVDVSPWSWPDHLHPAGPEWPLAAKRPESPMLGTPSGAPTRRAGAPGPRGGGP